MIRTTNSMSFISFLDILGFKEIVLNNSHDDLVKLYRTIQLALEFVQSHQIEGKKDKSRRKYNRIQSLIISDSIILWSEDIEYESFLEMIAILRMLFWISFEHGFPFRGALSLGPISKIANNAKTNSNSTNLTLVGKGLVDSYMIESKQNWSGCVISQNCIEHFQSDESTKQKINDYLSNLNIISYEVPYKNGPVKTEYVLNWLPLKYNEDFEDKIRKSFSANKKTVDVWDVKEKLNNTIKFYKEACTLLNGDGVFFDIDASNIHKLPKDMQISLLSMLSAMAKGEVLNGVKNIATGRYFSNENGLGGD